MSLSNAVERELKRKCKIKKISVLLDSGRTYKGYEAEAPHKSGTVTTWVKKRKDAIRFCKEEMRK